MIELRENGWEAPLKAYVEHGGSVIGICGGYQMLGKRITDPLGIEGDIREIDGLGLLDVGTELRLEKTVRNSNPVSVEFDCALEGYEIHMGATTGPDCGRPVIDFGDHRDGATSPGGNVQGCYLHGLFGSDAYRKALLEKLGHVGPEFSYRQGVEDALDELAEAMETHLDIDGLLATAR